MSNPESYILTLNGGSSSIKFALFIHETAEKVLEGKVDRIGMADTYLEVNDLERGTKIREGVASDAAIVRVLKTIEESVQGATLTAIGHRVVHGGTKYHEPTRIDASVITDLEQLTSFAPRHLPAEIALIRASMEHFPGVSHIACFDTGFYKHLPRRAQLLALPRVYEEKGVHRYGFHGLSYEFLLTELTKIVPYSIIGKKVVCAHLGSGASLTAIVDSVPIETTMGFTPTSGIPMGTRSGDLDPGLFEYFTEVLGLTHEEFTHMVNYDSGVKGVSGTTADMEILLREAPRDTRAEEAVTFFCYHVQKTIGALAAAMGGIDTLVFTGGMGEKSAEIRRRICADLGFLDIALDRESNESHAFYISRPESRVAVYMLPTNEEAMIVQHVRNVLAHT